MIVPSKNEAARLEATLAALANQVDLNGRPLQRERWEVFLLINNSTDDSFALANRFRQSHLSFPLRVAECRFDPEHAHIGHVRKLLMDGACERLSLRSKASSLIVSTDADTEVAPDWLAQNRAEACRGAGAVGGRISLQLRDLHKLDTQTRDIQLWNDEYCLLISWLEDRCDPQAHDPWPRHHQHFGGSLAVKPEIYRQVGGLPPKKALEDIAFYDILVRQDVKVRHSPDVCVHTSGRLRGRTAAGLAEQLSRWSSGPPVIAVPSVQLFQTFFSLRKRMRTLWLRVQAGDGIGWSALKSLSIACGATISEMEEALSCKWFGTAFESLNLRKKLENGLLNGEAFQSLPKAVHQLQTQFRSTRRRFSGFPIEEVQSGIAAL